MEATSMRTGIVILAAAVFASGCASVFNENSALTAFPYRIGESGRFIVEVMVNEQGPFDFAFDTGASISVLFDGARKKLDIEHVAGKRVLIHGMVGSGEFPTASLDEMRIGNATWTNARVASLPGDTSASTGIDGILGVDFLHHYAASFSVDEQVVCLYAPEQVSESSYRGWASIPLQRMQIGSGSATVYVVDLQIGSGTIRALLDLGAGANMMNWQAAAVIGVRPVAPRKTSNVSGAVDSAPLVAQLVVEVMQIANISWRNQVFLIGDPPVFSALGIHGQPLAIAGSSLFNTRDLLVDLERERLLVRTEK